MTLTATTTGPSTVRVRLQVLTPLAARFKSDPNVRTSDQHGGT